jgi:dihydrofolate reductase
MRKLVLLMHISLDGFTARPNGEMDWINIEEEMFDVAGQRTREADTAIYGRGTYKLIQSYWPTAADQPNATKHDIEHSTWYKQVEKIVISSTLKGIDYPNARIIRKNLIAEIRKLKEAPGKEIIMFWSPTLAHTLTEENLIDHYFLLVNPILLGKGIPLFSNLKHTVKLKLLANNTFASGVVCLHYEAVIDN